MYIISVSSEIARNAFKARGNNRSQRANVEERERSLQTSKAHYDVNYYEYGCRVYKSRMTLMMLMEERTGQEVLIQMIVKCDGTWM